MSKKFSVSALVIGVCFLSACHKNPLKTQPEHDSTRFLINASMAAEKKLHLGLGDSLAQRAYLNCMDGKNTPFDCNALYQAMADFSQKAAFSEFREVTRADLTDKSVFKRLRAGYEERFFFNNLEH